MILLLLLLLLFKRSESDSISKSASTISEAKPVLLWCRNRNSTRRCRATRNREPIEGDDATRRATTSRLRDCGSSRFRSNLRRGEKDWEELKAATMSKRCLRDAFRGGVTKASRRAGVTSWRRRRSFWAGHRIKKGLGFVLLLSDHRLRIEPEMKQNCLTVTINVIQTGLVVV